jgi:hypothetical protein
MQHARQSDIGAELAAPFEEARVLKPWKPGADAKFTCHETPRRSRSAIQPRLFIQFANALSRFLIFAVICEEPTDPREVARSDDKLRDD